MLQKERQREIINLVNDRSGCTVAELAAELGVSETTIRRDLRELAGQNRITRTHGGAMPVVDSGKPYEDKRVYNREQKRAIGKRAATEIASNQRVCFDSGSTTLAVARQLSGDSAVSPVTPMPAIARELADAGLEPELTGGTYRHETRTCVGPWAEKYLQQLNVDQLILCADGIDSDGLMVRNVHQSYLKELMIERADRVILVADHSKFDASHAHYFADHESVDLFVTDEIVPDRIRRAFESGGVDVIENVYSS